MLATLKTMRDAYHAQVPPACRSSTILSQMSPLESYSLIFARSLPIVNVILVLSDPHSEHVLVIAEEVKFVIADLERATTELWDEDLVACCHAHGCPRAVLVEPAGPNSQDLGLIELLD